MGGTGTHNMLLVVGGAPVLGAPVADAKQQRPPAGAHGSGGGEQRGTERCRVRAEEATRVEGFGSDFGARGFGLRWGCDIHSELWTGL